MSDELKVGETHPSSQIAYDYIMKNCGDMYILMESLSSCAIEGNRSAEVCAGTLSRLLRREPVSDRYLMGLAWFLYAMNSSDASVARSVNKVGKNKVHKKVKKSTNNRH
jgi:hypothetical protein